MRQRGDSDGCGSVAGETGFACWRIAPASASWPGYASGWLLPQRVRRAKPEARLTRAPKPTPASAPLYIGVLHDLLNPGAGAQGRLNVSSGVAADTVNADTASSASLCTTGGSQ